MSRHKLMLDFLKVTMESDTELSDLQDIPGYKTILKAVLKSQMQGLVKQLANHTEEESVLISVNIRDGTFSHIGSSTGKAFLTKHDDIKSQFLGFCLKRHQQHPDSHTDESKVFDSSEPLHSTVYNKKPIRKQRRKSRAAPYSVRHQSSRARCDIRHKDVLDPGPPIIEYMDDAAPPINEYTNDTGPPTIEYKKDASPPGGFTNDAVSQTSSHKKHAVQRNVKITRKKKGQKPLNHNNDDDDESGNDDNDNHGVGISSLSSRSTMTADKIKNEDGTASLHSSTEVANQKSTSTYTNTDHHKRSCNVITKSEATSTETLDSNEHGSVEHYLNYSSRTLASSTGREIDNKQTIKSGSRLLPEVCDEGSQCSVTTEGSKAIKYKLESRNDVVESDMTDERSALSKYYDADADNEMSSASMTKQMTESESDNGADNIDVEGDESVENLQRRADDELSDSKKCNVELEVQNMSAKDENAFKTATSQTLDNTEPLVESSKDNNDVESESNEERKEMASSEERDVHKSERTDNTGRTDKHFKVLAIWNDIANDSDEAGNEVLYDLISAKLKNEMDKDKKNKVEEGSQTESLAVGAQTDFKSAVSKCSATESDKLLETKEDDSSDSRSDSRSGFKHSAEDVNMKISHVRSNHDTSDKTEKSSVATFTEVNSNVKDTVKANEVENASPSKVVLEPSAVNNSKQQNADIKGSSSEIPETIVIDNDNTASPVKKSVNLIRKTPSKAPVRSISDERRSPSHSSRPSNQSTPSKRNFIDKLISKGVPIIIPDEEEEVMPSPRSTAFKSKAKQFPDSKTPIRSPKAMQNFPVYMEPTSQALGHVPYSQMTDINSPHQLHYSTSDIGRSPNRGHPSPGASQHLAGRYSSQVSSQVYDGMNPLQSYHSPNSSSKYPDMSPSQSYQVQNPASKYPDMSPSQQFPAYGVDKTKQFYSPSHPLSRQRLFSPSKYSKESSSVDKNVKFANPINDSMAQMANYSGSPIRQSFSPPVTPSKARNSNPDYTTPTKSPSLSKPVASQFSHGSSPSVLPKSVKGSGNARRSAPRIPSGTTIVIDEEPVTSMQSDGPRNVFKRSQEDVYKRSQEEVFKRSQEEVFKRSHEEVFKRSQEDVFKRSQDLFKGNQDMPKDMKVSSTHGNIPQSFQTINPVSVQTDNPSLPVITNVTSLPMLADNTNQPTSEALSQALTQQLVFVPVQVISQMPSVDIQNINEKTPIKRERIDDSDTSPSGISEPVLKRSHLMEQESAPSSMDLNNQPSLMNEKSSMMLEDEVPVDKITPKIEIDIDDVTGQMIPVCSPPASRNSTDNESHSSKTASEQETSSTSSSARQSQSESKRKSKKSSGNGKKTSEPKEEQTDVSSPNTKLKDFGCGDCGKSFKSKAALNTHFKKHTQDRPFECDVCGKHFSQKGYLKKHIYTHFKEKE
ncbi:hypothetical protein ACF0H5_022481 [Mactra antiquata]